MRGVVEKIIAALRSLYDSPEAERAVKESETMKDLTARLVTIGIGLLIAGAVGTEKKASKWPAARGS